MTFMEYRGIFNPNVSKIIFIKLLNNPHFTRILTTSGMTRAVTILLTTSVLRSAPTVLSRKHVALNWTEIKICLNYSNI